MKIKFNKKTLPNKIKKLYVCKFHPRIKQKKYFQPTTIINNIKNVDELKLCGLKKIDDKFMLIYPLIRKEMKKSS